MLHRRRLSSATTRPLRSYVRFVRAARRMRRTRRALDSGTLDPSPRSVSAPGQLHPPAQRSTSAALPIEGGAHRAAEAGQHIEAVEGVILAKRDGDFIRPMHVHRSGGGVHDPDEADAVA